LLCILVVAEITVVVDAALMQFIESDQNLPYHSWIYFIWVTYASVGYGEIVPYSPVGRFTTMAIIGFAVVQVPMLSGELIEKITSQSVYARQSYHPKNDNSKHVLICGDLVSTAISEFFDELFHEDHSDDDIHAVVLQIGEVNLGIYYSCLTRLIDAVLMSQSRLPGK
jgi:hypothetical protein